MESEESTNPLLSSDTPEYLAVTSTNTQTKSIQDTSGQTTIMPETSGAWKPKVSPITIFSVLDSLVPRSATRGLGKDLRIPVERFSSRLPELRQLRNPKLYSLKTLMASFQQEYLSVQESIDQLKVTERENLQKIYKESKTAPKEAGKKLKSMLREVTVSLKSSSPWKDFAITSNGKCLTASNTEYRKIAPESSLLDILERDPRQRYFLSEKMMSYLIKRSIKEQKKINLWDFSKPSKKNQIAGTLTAGAHSGGLHSDMTLIIDPYNQNTKENGLAGSLKTNQGSPRSMTTAIAKPFIKNVPHGYNDGFEKRFPNLRASRSEYNELVVIPVGPEMPCVRTSGRGSLDKHAWDTLIVSNAVDTSGWLREMGRHEEGKHGLTDYRIRRLTPIECERLQGFPDEWTKGVSDTQRYKCLGNAVTVNVIHFIGARISTVLSKIKRTLE